MDDNAELSYISSVDPFQPEKKDPSVDVADEKALVRVAKVVDAQIKVYHTLSGMKRFDTIKFSANQREALCDQMVQELSGLKRIIDNAIDGIKGDNGERR